MIEPTETESQETLDQFIDARCARSPTRRVHEPDLLHERAAPHAGQAAG